MEPTITPTQRILVNRFIYHFSSPKIGDIVVFHPPQGAKNGNECGTTQPQGAPCPEPTEGQWTDENFIKRVVAGPGDHVRIIGGLPIVNGRANPKANDHICKESSQCPGEDGVPGEVCGKPRRDKAGKIQADGTCNLPTTITIPPGHFFMMGDNRDSSDDSRFWGPIPQDWMIGKAFATYWPPRRIGIF
jgi:signal peptidase I